MMPEFEIEEPAWREHFTLEASAQVEYIRLAEGPIAAQDVILRCFRRRRYAMKVNERTVQSVLQEREMERRKSHEVLLRRALPLLVALGDYIGNGPVIGLRGNSLGMRCDLIADIEAAILEPLSPADQAGMREIMAEDLKFLGAWARLCR
jgi:hypothetical protein